MKKLFILLFFVVPFLSFDIDSSLYDKMDRDYVKFRSTKKGAKTTEWEIREDYNKAYLDMFAGDYVFSVSDLSVERFSRYLKIVDDETWYKEYLETRHKDATPVTKEVWDQATREEKYNMYFAVYYVRDDGNDSNTGTSNTSGGAWATLSKAVATAVAGDIVHIKAGSYSDYSLVSTRSGTSGNPITFSGFNTTPGDLDVTLGPGYTRADFEAEATPNVLTEGGWPLFENAGRGVDKIPGNNDWLVRVFHDYIHFKNLKLQYYQTGFQVTGANPSQREGVVIDNMVMNEFGNWDSTDPGYGTDYWPGGGITGSGVIFQGVDSNFAATCPYSETQGVDNSTISNCIFFDMGHVGIQMTLGSDNNTVKNCEIYYLRTGNGTDYCFDMYGANNNTITNIKAHKEIAGGHNSRGLNMKSYSSNNYIDGYDVKNTIFTINEGSTANEIRNVSLEGNLGLSEFTGSFGIHGGAELNFFYNVRTNNCQAVKLQFFGGEFCGISTTANASINNYFINPIFSNIIPQKGFVETRTVFDVNTGNAGSIYFVNGVFDNSDYMFNAGRDNDQFTFVNCSFSNVPQGYEILPAGAKNTTYNYSNCNFSNTNFTTPGGTNITTGEPGFLDRVNGNYKISASGALYQAGTNPNVYEPASLLGDFNLDFNDNARTAPYDIGAYIFNSEDVDQGGGGTTPITGSGKQIVNALLINN